MASNITYKDFKSEVLATFGYDFSHPIMNAGSPIHEVEDEGARNS